MNMVTMVDGRPETLKERLTRRLANLQKDVVETEEALKALNTPGLEALLSLLQKY